MIEREQNISFVQKLDLFNKGTAIDPNAKVAFDQAKTATQLKHKTTDEELAKEKALAQQKRQEELEKLKKTKEEEIRKREEEQAKQKEKEEQLKQQRLQEMERVKKEKEAALVAARAVLDKQSEYDEAYRARRMEELAKLKAQREAEVAKIREELAKGTNYSEVAKREQEERLAKLKAEKEAEEIKIREELYNKSYYSETTRRRQEENLIKPNSINELIEKPEYETITHYKELNSIGFEESTEIEQDSFIDIPLVQHDGIISYLRSYGKDSVKLSCSSTWSGPIENLFSYDNSFWSSQDIENSWILIEFITNKIILGGYLLRHDEDPNYIIINWKLEGSNDKSKWTLVDSQKFNHSIKTSYGEAIFKCNSNAPFSFFKLTQTGPNSSISPTFSNVITLTFIEFFGKISK